MNPTPPTPQEQELTILHNNFTIYHSKRKGKPALMEHARPQDWGDPKYTYRSYYYEATIAGQKYGHHCHCWTDAPALEEWEYPSFFAPCVVQLLMPGTPREEVGRRYLGEEDFWNDEWGPRPPYFDEFSEN